MTAKRDCEGRTDAEMKVCTEEEYWKALGEEDDGIRGFRCLVCLNNYATREEAEQCSKPMPDMPEQLREYREYLRRKVMKAMAKDVC